MNRTGFSEGGLTTDERQQLKAPQRENVELKRANEILRKTPPWASSALNRPSRVAARAQPDEDLNATGESGRYWTASVASSRSA